MSYLIKDTTEEERRRIVEESTPISEARWNCGISTWPIARAM